MTDTLIAPALQRALDDRNYTDLTPVQTAVVTPEAQGRDLLVSAQTGSGKTVAYGLSLARDLLGDEERLGPAQSPLALVIAPTRELALQVQRELAWLYAKASARIIATVGGMDPQRERRMLNEGAHIVVGTPGRLRDHIERNRLDLSQIRTVVLDEADEMLDLGFREDLEFMLEAMPENKRTLLFSATLPRGIAALAKRYQRDAFRIETVSATTGHVDIEYQAIHIAPKDAERVIINVLRSVDAPASIIFCNTRESVRHLQATLLERGFSAVYLSGELGQHERNQALQALRDGRAKVCVATDVAARGIDLPHLGLVIHAELPNDPEILQHRSGRTGRAGRKGISVVIVPPSRRCKAEDLMRGAGVEPRWITAPSYDDIRALDRDRFLADPSLHEDLSDDDFIMADLLMAERPPREIAAIVARLYRARLPEPAEITDTSVFMTRNADQRERKRPGKAERALMRAKDREVGRSAGRPQHKGAREIAVSEEGFVRFRIEIGRRNKADPKWLLPMLCRRGKVTKDDIGAIRIFDNATEVEISGEAAERFAVNIRKTDGDDIRINPLAPGEQAEREAPHRSGPPRSPKPRKASDHNPPERDAAQGERRQAPWASKSSGGGKPSGDRPGGKKSAGKRLDGYRPEGGSRSGGFKGRRREG